MITFLFFYFFFFFWGGVYLLRIIWNWSEGNGKGESEIKNQHCQRHNGPRGWVLSPNGTMIKQVLTTTFTAKQLLNLDKTSTSKFHCKSRLVLIFTLSAWIRWKWTMLNPIIQFWLSQKRGKNLNCVAEPKAQEFRSLDYTGEKGLIFLIELMIA